MFISCQQPSSFAEGPSADHMLSNYYKNKHIDKSLILREKHRIILDSVVIRLEETNEPEEVIQYIVNDYKLKHGIK